MKWLGLKSQESLSRVSDLLEGQGGVQTRVLSHRDVSLCAESSAGRSSFEWNACCRAEGSEQLQVDAGLHQGFTCAFFGEIHHTFQ